MGYGSYYDVCYDLDCRFDEAGFVQQSTPSNRSQLDIIECQIQPGHGRCHTSQIAMNMTHIHEQALHLQLFNLHVS